MFKTFLTHVIAPRQRTYGLLWLATVGIHWAQIPELSASESYDSLIAFLQERPPVERLVFKSESNLLKKKITERMEAEHPGRKVTFHDGQYYLGRREGVSFLLRQNGSLEKLDSLTKSTSNLYSGRTESIRWNYWDPNSMRLLSVDGPKSESERIDIQHNDIARSHMESVLNLGILNIGKSSLDFDGTEFSGTTDDGRILKGQLELNDNGMPVALEYSHQNNPTTVICRFQYGLTEGIPSFYPNIISRFVKRDGKETAVGETNILELTIATKPIAEERFLPQELRPAHRRQKPVMLKYTNGILHELGHKLEAK